MNEGQQLLEETKDCRVCFKTKPITHYRVSAYGRMHMCQDCFTIRQKAGWVEKRKRLARAEAAKRSWDTRRAGKSIESHVAYIRPNEKDVPAIAPLQEKKTFNIKIDRLALKSMHNKTLQIFVSQDEKTVLGIHPETGTAITIYREE